MCNQLYDRILIKGKIEFIFRNVVTGEVRRYLEDNVFTEVGDAYVADQLSDRDLAQMSHMEIGTGTGGGASSTTLVTPIARVPLDGAPKQGSGVNDNDVIYSAVYPPGTGTGAITEAGIFNAAAGGTMLSYSSFPVKNKGALDNLTINWTHTHGAS